jgi:hypothetical protein
MRGEDVVVAIEVSLEVAGVMTVSPRYACLALQVWGRIYSHQALPTCIPLKSDLPLPAATSGPTILLLVIHQLPRRDLAEPLALLQQPFPLGPLLGLHALSTSHCPLGPLQ